MNTDVKIVNDNDNVKITTDNVTIENLKENSYDVVLKNGDRYKVDVESPLRRTDCTRDCTLTLTGQKINSAFVLKGILPDIYIEKDSLYASTFRLPNLNGPYTPKQEDLKTLFATVFFEPFSSIRSHFGHSVFLSFLFEQGSLESMVKKVQEGQQEKSNLNTILEALNRENSNSR